MSKKQDKADKKRNVSPSMSPAAVLRPRLETLWANPAWPQGEESALRADLSAVVRGTDVPFFLRTMLRAYQAALAPAQSRLAQVLPGWLQDNGYVAELAQIASESSLDDASRNLALSWLQVGGADTSAPAVRQEEETFYGAYHYGDGSQAILIVLWCTDRKRSRVQGFSFLLDFNPPWEGAVKDITALPRRHRQAAIRDFVGIWEERDMVLAPLSAEEAANKLLEALERNRQESIRLPDDLISHRDSFQRHVLPLLERASGGNFTMAGFDELSRISRTAESIMHYEHTVGRRVRMEDGKEVFFLGVDDWGNDE